MLELDPRNHTKPHEKKTAKAIERLYSVLFVVLIPGEGGKSDEVSKLHPRSSMPSE